VTSGVVSRIEILSYVHGSTELLGLQVWIIDHPLSSSSGGSFKVSWFSVINFIFCR
jgi:hypothetical protein